MLKYKINVGDALERIGFNTYQAKKTGLLSQDTLRKIRNEDTSISLKALNAVCMLLEMQPKDILVYEETEVEKKLKNFKNVT